MAMRLLETPPTVVGDVVECGCWKGAATINLSLIAAITGRKLKVYDSFEGLPPPLEGDPHALRAFRNGYIPGVLSGSVEEVSANVRQYGAIEVCEFHKGWFEDTLPHHRGDIVLAFWDVDFYSSLHDCLVNLWPSVVDGGYVFLDEFRNIPCFHAFKGGVTGARIDFVFHTIHFKAKAAEIVRTSRDGRYPSDHYPVTAILAWKE